MTPVEIRQLECFIAVAEEKHIGKAAVRLRMTQPPLTRRMARLEREMKVRLLVRTQNGVELTEAGHILHERAYRIVRLAEHTVERVRTAAAGRCGSLVIGYFGATILGFLPRVLSEFVRAHPEVDIVLERAPKNVQAEAVRDGRMHLGFSRRHASEDGLLVRRLTSESLCVAVPAGHRLTELDGVRVADLRDEKMVLFPGSPRPGFADHVIAMCLSEGFDVRVDRIADDVITAVSYVAIVNACAVVPASATALGLPDVVYLPLIDAPDEEFSCLYRAQPPSPLAGAFLEFVDRGTDGSAGPLNWAHAR